MSPQTSHDSIASAGKSIETCAIIWRACSCGQSNPKRTFDENGFEKQSFWKECPVCGNSAVIENLGVIDADYKNWNHAFLHRIIVKTKKLFGLYPSHKSWLGDRDQIAEMIASSSE